MEQEQKWIRSILHRGSRKAADALVRSYYDEIYVYVYRQVGNREDALDLTQECFISALRSLHTYDSRKAGFRTWLYHIASCRIIDLRRKGSHILVPFEEMEIVSEEDFTQGVQNRELLTAVEDYVCRTDPAVQEVFRLRVYGGYSFPEIAQAMAQPETKIKAQYYRLAARLREEYGE